MPKLNEKVTNESFAGRLCRLGNSVFRWSKRSAKNLMTHIRCFVRPLGCHQDQHLPQVAGQCSLGLTDTMEEMVAKRPHYLQLTGRNLIALQGVAS